MSLHSPIRVLLVDDHAVVRAGYRRFLEHNRAMEVVGEAGTSDEAYQLFRMLKPDVVVMDISLPGASGIEATRRMLALDNRARVLMFSMHAQPAFARQALEAGAIGFLLRRDRFVAANLFAVCRCPAIGTNGHDEAAIAVFG